jgi:hypothetical protein
MPAIIKASNLLDLVSTTLDDLGRLRWTNIAYDLQQHIAMKNLMRKSRVQFSGGTNIRFNVQTRTTGAAKMTGLLATDAFDIGDTMSYGSIDWRHATVNWAVERREMKFNRGPSQIVDLIESRRNAAMIDQALLMERQFWRRPAASTDTLNAFGVPYWITYGTPTGNGGFFGLNPTGYTAGAGGIDSVANARWSNWSANYTAVTKGDLIAKWRRAARFTDFRPPVDNADYNSGDDFGYYTNYNVLGTIESLLEDQNDNLGNDVASKDGAAVFRRTPITWAPVLEGRTGDPIYGINWGVFKTVFLAGEYMLEDGPNKAPNQHTAFVTHIDTTFNFLCYDRRRNFVLATADPDETW